MKALAVLHYPMFSGPTNFVARMHGPLGERGVELEALLPDEPGDAAARLHAAGVPTGAIPLHRLRASLNPAVQARFAAGLVGDVRRIRSVIRRRRVDAVLLTGLANPHGALAAHGEGVPVLWQIVDTRVPASARRVLMPLVARYADAVVFLGESLQALHTGGQPLPVPTLLGHYPVDLERFVPSPERRAATRAELGLPAGAAVVGTVANLTPQKGVEHFVAAAGRIAAVRPDTWFVVVGGEYDTHRDYARSLRVAVAEAGLGERFVFAGSRRDTEACYPAMDVKLITSVPASEGIPTTSLEAMACGVPVVTTDVGATAEAVLDGETGYVVPPLDDAAVADRTLELLADPERRRALGAAGRERAVARYGIGPAVELHLRAFRLAAEHRRGRSRGRRVGRRAPARSG